MIGENKPWAYSKPYQTPIELVKIGPRTMRFVHDTDLFGTTIPKDYEVDGASAPRMVWFVLSPFTEAFRAACVHDLRHHPGMSWRERKDADDEFYQNLRRCELNIIRCVSAWIGVRAWAWLTFWKWRR